MTANDFLKKKGIHPTEPIYWDFGSNRIMLDELLQEFLDQQNQSLTDQLAEAKKENEELKKQVEMLNLAEDSYVRQIYNERSISQSKISELEKDRDEYRERYTCNQHTVVNIQSELSKQKELVEDLNNMQQDMCKTIESLQEQIEALKKDREDLAKVNRGLAEDFSNALSDNESQSLRIKELEETAMQLFNLVHDSDIIENKIKANDLYEFFKPNKKQ